MDSSSKPHGTEEWISISEAARRLDMSRRTLRRRIDAADLETQERQVEGRVTRLMRRTDLDHLIAPTASLHAESWRSTMDQVLERTYAAYARLDEALYYEGAEPVDLACLREGPLGKDLVWIGHLVQDDAPSYGEIGDDRVEGVLHLLFTSPLSIEMAIPPAFWESELGRLISLAKLRTYDKGELVTIAEAAAALQVTRPTIYRWMDEKVLRSVRDERFQRTLIVRDDIDDLMRQVDGQQQTGQEERASELVSALGGD